MDKPLDKKYRNHCFIKEDLENILGFKLDIGHQLITLPDYLVPYISRTNISLKETANILAGCKPSEIINRVPDCNIVDGYQKSLWDAVDSGILSGKNEIFDYDFNQELRVDITLVKDEVTQWAQKYNFNWPFALQENEESPHSDGIEDSSPIEDMESLKNEIIQLKEKLNEVTSKLPIMLGQYRDDDPLLLAIQIRNTEWVNYNEDERKTTPSQVGIIASLQERYGKGMPEAQAKAIEKVACPIKRKS